jgi:NitT/TauT family transport system substrate-binding protein
MKIRALVFALLPLAAAADPTPVVLAVDGIKMIRNLPVLLADHLGYYKAEGLQVTLKETAAGPDIDSQLVDGRITGMVAYYHHTIVAQMEEHKAMEAVITMGVSPGYKVLLAIGLKGQVNGPADLKGKRIISGGPHSAKTTSANGLVLHAGFQPSDYTRLSTGDKAEIARLLKTGGADLVVTPEADAETYLAKGVAVPYADLCSAEGTRRAFGSIFPSTVLYMSTPYVDEHPELAQHLVNAFSAALQYLKTHSTAEVAAQVPEIVAGEGKNPRVLAEGIKMFATDGLMPPAAAALEAKVVAVQFPQYGGVDVSKTFTNRFVTHAASQ